MGIMDVSGRIDVIQGPRSPCLDPVTQHLLFRSGQGRPLLRHVVALHHFPKQALLRFTRHNRRPLRSARKSGNPTRKIQLPLSISRVVALQAMLGQQRSHLGFEKASAFFPLAGRQQIGSIRTCPGLEILFHILRRQGAAVNR